MGPYYWKHGIHTRSSKIRKVTKELVDECLVSVLTLRPVLTQYFVYFNKVSYRLDLPEERIHIHNTFHVSQLQKCLANSSTMVPLDDIQVDERLNYMEKPIGILDERTKAFCNKVVTLVKV